MRYHTSTSNKEIHYFTCSDNKVDYRGKCPGRHYVRADALEEVVKLELRRLVEMLEIDESYFAQLLLRKNDERKEKKDKKVFGVGTAKSDCSQRYGIATL